MRNNDKEFEQIIDLLKRFYPIELCYRYIGLLFGFTLTSHPILQILSVFAFTLCLIVNAKDSYRGYVNNFANLIAVFCFLFALPHPFNIVAVCFGILVALIMFALYEKAKNMD